MSVALEDGLVAAAAAAGGVGMLTWLVEFGRLEAEGVEAGEWFFRIVGAVCTLAAFAWAVASFWSITPLLALATPAPSLVVAVVVMRLTRRWKKPTRQG